MGMMWQKNWIHKICFFLNRDNSFLLSFSVNPYLNKEKGKKIKYKPIIIQICFLLKNKKYPQTHKQDDTQEKITRTNHASKNRTITKVYKNAILSKKQLKKLLKHMIKIKF